MNFAQIRKLIHRTDPYEGFNADALPLDLQGWAQDETTIPELIMQMQPSLVVEVGSWKGYSANMIASTLKTLPHDSGLICVDTWLGAREFWSTTEEKEEMWWSSMVANEAFHAERYDALGLKHGYPTVYYQFLANMVHLGHKDIVTPFPQTSTLAGRWLRSHGVQAELVYVDASHEYDDVLSDMNIYWDIVTPGGMMFGDDYWIDDIRRAVADFAKKRKLTIESNDRFWILRKPH
jgi:hypothetical protein